MKNVFESTRGCAGGAVFGCAFLASIAGLCLPAFGDDDDKKLLDKQPAIRGPRVSPDPWKSESRLPAVPREMDSTYPSKNINFKSWLALNQFTGFSAGDNAADCWGYTSPSGREYALVGLSWGNGIVEVTNPAAPVIITVVPGGVNSLWRDIAVIGNYAYAVSDDVGVGIQVLNLANIDSGSVTLVRNYTQAGGGHFTTHSLVDNPASGFMYAQGGNAAGGRCIPVATSPDPTFPTFTGVQSPTAYVHEAMAKTFTSGPYAGKEIVFLFTGTSGMEILDWTNKAAPITLFEGSYPGEQYGHQGWITDDYKYLYLNDELDSPSAGNVPRFLTRVFDITTLTAPRLISTISNGLPSVDHNEYVKGRYLYQSNYTTGLRVWDLSNPLKPYEVAWLDSRPEDDGTGYNGSWGNFPFFNSGTILISDLERGLITCKLSIIEFNNTIVYPTTLTPGAATPISATITSFDGAAVGAMNLRVSVNGAAYTSYPMSHQGGGVYAGNIPALNGFDRVRYYMQTDTTDLPSRPFTWPLDAANGQVFTAYVQNGQTTLFSDNFQSNLGWTVSGTATAGAWVRATPIFNGGSAAVIGDADGSGSCYVTGNTLNARVTGGSTILTSPTLDLSSAPQARISYSRWLCSLVGTTDTLVTEISNNNGTSWVNVETLGPVSGGWSAKTIRVADYVAPTAQVRMRYTVANADTSITEAGLDAILVVNPTVAASCYANCDGSTGSPLLTANDFQCFINAYAGNQAYANCDQSTGNPLLTANDFQCFINAFASGCP